MVLSDWGRRRCLLFFLWDGGRDVHLAADQLNAGFDIGYILLEVCQLIEHEGVGLIGRVQGFGRHFFRWEWVF